MKQKPNIVATPIVNEEEKAFQFLMMHFNRVATLDEISNKAIDRTGRQMSKAIRELLGSIQVYHAVRNGASVKVLENGK